MDVAVGLLRSLVENQRWTQSLKYNSPVFAADAFRVTHYAFMTKIEAGAERDFERSYNLELCEMQRRALRVLVLPDAVEDGFQTLLLMFTVAQLQKAVAEL